MKNGYTATILAVVLVFAACSSSRDAGGNEPAPAAEPVQQASTVARVQEQFVRHVCGDIEECAVNDIADPELNYADWLAAKLGVDALSALGSGESFYIEAGPDGDGATVSLGAVEYPGVDSVQRQAVMTALEKLPDGVFKDDHVVMRFKAIDADDQLLLLFSDSFHPAVDSFFTQSR